MMIAVLAATYCRGNNGSTAIVRDSAGVQIIENKGSA